MAFTLGPIVVNLDITHRSTVTARILRATTEAFGSQRLIETHGLCHVARQSFNVRNLGEQLIGPVISKCKQTRNIVLLTFIRENKKRTRVFLALKRGLCQRQIERALSWSLWNCGEAFRYWQTLFCRAYFANYVKIIRNQCGDWIYAVFFFYINNSGELSLKKLKSESGTIEQ